MQATVTTFTVAEYCDQMESGTIVVNRDYQRSETVWPPAARSFLIDTLLSGYPMPKISLRQITDREKKRTIKEIVDGQQRSRAIHDFWSDKLRITGRSDFAGKTYSQLEPEQQQQFLEYALTVDLIVGASEEAIRDMFRRINSYTAPVNRQEDRHAKYQGTFKWFIVDLTRNYSQHLKTLGVFTERLLSRMRDAELFTAILRALFAGIETHSQALLDKMYAVNDEVFPQEREYQERMDALFDALFRMKDLHNGPLMKSANLYSLALAIMHFLDPVETLTPLKQSEGAILDVDASVRRLAELAEAIESASPSKKHVDFVKAASAGTNTQTNRTKRFRALFDALRPA